MEKEEFENDIDNKFNYSNIDELQNSYELYKSVMNTIIGNLITVLVCKYHKSEKLKIKIFKPIILGLLSANWNTNPKRNNCYNIDRCSVNPCCGTYMYQISHLKNTNQYCTDYDITETNQIEKLYTTIEQNTTKIDEKFDITNKILEIE